jgi:hypothetical protein
VDEVKVMAADLDNAVFKIPVEECVSLWVARFGNDWVAESEVNSDDFYQWIAYRLKRIGRVEVFDIWDADGAQRPGKRYRIVE